MRAMMPLRTRVRAGSRCFSGSLVKAKGTQQSTAFQKHYDCHSNISLVLLPCNLYL